MVDQVRPSELDDWLEAHAVPGRPPLMIDVREPWEIQQAAVSAEGFDIALIPMNTVPARIGELDASRPVAVLCHHGSRSQRVALFLEHQGFAHVCNIAGGIDAWSQELDASIPRY